MSRRTLISLAVLVLALGAGLFGYLHAQSNPAPEVRRDGLEAVIDVSGMKPGQLLEVSGLDLPVWVLRRSPAMLAALGVPAAPLDDPQSVRSVQPTGLDPGLRSAQPEFFVMVPIFHVVNGRTGVWSTVSVQHAPADETPRLLAGALHTWAGGFKDNAGRGIHFDYAGRVYRYASIWTGFASNIAVPRHEFLTRTKLRVDIANLLNHPNMHGDTARPGS